jgi:hypothetical protein
MEKNNNSENKFTVCLWPGSGYVLFPFEVEAESETEVLENAVKKALDTNHNILGFYRNKKEIKELLYYYKEERKKFDRDYEFITQYLNYYFIEELNYFVSMENTKIEKGWNLYENSIPLVEEDGLKAISV